MSNMSYCRFRNTLNDFRDCSSALLDEEPLEGEEASAASHLLTEMAELLEELHVDVDWEQLQAAKTRLGLIS